MSDYPDHRLPMRCDGCGQMTDEPTSNAKGGAPGGDYCPSCVAYLSDNPSRGHQQYKLREGDE